MATNFHSTTLQTIKIPCPSLPEVSAQVCMPKEPGEGAKEPGERAKEPGERAKEPGERAKTKEQKGPVKEILPHSKEPY